MSVYYWLTLLFVLVGLAVLLAVVLRALAATRRFEVARAVLAGKVSGEVGVLQVRGAALRNALPRRRNKRTMASGQTATPGTIEVLGR